MARIPWIEDTVEEFATPRLRELVDEDAANRVARQEDLGIEEPARRVGEFVDALPALFAWFGEHYRDFPWRRTRDPWEVIVAEVLLQRTRAATVDGMYETFLERFPGPEAVVDADRETIFDTIESLGFGNRKTETLEALANTVITQHGGTVPDDLDSLLALPRIGPYTARACLCFAYGQPLALVDANVATVAEHALGYSSATRAHKDRGLYALLDALIPGHPDAARVFNLALLDLRTRVCAAESSARTCPLAPGCQHTPTSTK